MDGCIWECSHGALPVDTGRLTKQLTRTPSPVDPGPLYGSRPASFVRLQPLSTDKHLSAPQTQHITRQVTLQRSRILPWGHPCNITYMPNHTLRRKQPQVHNSRHSRSMQAPAVATLQSQHCCWRGLHSLKQDCMRPAAQNPCKSCRSAAVQIRACLHHCQAGTSSPDARL